MLTLGFTQRQSSANIHAYVLPVFNLSPVRSVLTMKYPQAYVVWYNVFIIIGVQYGHHNRCLIAEYHSRYARSTIRRGYINYSRRKSP